MNMKDVSIALTVLFVGGCALSVTNWLLAIVCCIWLVHEGYEYTFSKEETV